MKKILCLVISILMLTSASTMGAEFQFPKYSEAVDYGRGSWSAVTHSSSVTYDENKNPIFCFMTQGGYFFAINLETGEFVDKFKTSGQYIYSQIMATGTDGLVYMQYYPEYIFEVYDPVNHTFTTRVPDEKIYVMGGGMINDKGQLILGNYSDKGASLWVYEEKTLDLKEYGPLNTNCHYVKGTEEDENYYYAGMGTGAPNAFVIRIDKKTGEQTEFLKGTGGGIIYELQRVGKYLLAKTYGKTTVADLDTLEVVDSFASAGTDEESSAESPSEENTVYYKKSSSVLMKYNVVTKEHLTVLEDENLKGLKLKKWATLKNGDHVITLMSTQMEKVGYYNPKTNELTIHTLSETADAGPEIQCFEISEFNVAYIGGYQNSMGVYNIDTGEFLYSLPSWLQNEGTGFLNGKTYFGTYVDAVLYSYDPEKPLNYHSYNYDTKTRPIEHNPRMVYDIEENQDRPFVMKSYKGKVYAGTMSGYGEIGGAVTIYEEDDCENPSAEVIRNIVENQSITGIAFKDNLMYVSGTIRGGLGITPIETEAKMTVYDLDAKKIIKKDIKPKLPEIGTASETIGEISFGPDGLLWGVSNRNSLVFALDPETFEVKKSVSVKGRELPAQARPLYLRWGDDGLLYTNAGWNLTVINPETLEYKTLHDNSLLFTLDMNGNVWYCVENNFYKMEINQYDRLSNFLNTLGNLKKEDYTKEEWSKLEQAINEAKGFTESTDKTVISEKIKQIKHLRDKTEPYKYENAVKISFNGKEIILNEKTGVSKLYNGRTLVPYDTLFELLGYDAKWNVLSHTMTAKNENNEVIMTMGKDTYTIDGKEFKTDVPLMVLSHRHYVPLRSICESLGYKVLWDEQGQAVSIEK